MHERNKIVSSQLDGNLLNPSCGEQFHVQAMERATSLQVHVHQNKVGGTCTTGKKGNNQCRLSQPQPLGNGTKFYRLHKGSNDSFVHERIRSQADLSSRFENNERNWNDDPLDNSHQFCPSSSPPLIMIQNKRGEINLLFNRENSEEILQKLNAPHHRLANIDVSSSNSIDEDNCSINSFTPPTPIMSSFQNYGDNEHGRDDNVHDIRHDRREDDVDHSNQERTNSRLRENESYIYKKINLCPDLHSRIQQMSARDKDLLLEACKSRNGYFVEFIPEITQLLGCNTAPYYLGTPEQAKAIMFYIIKYVTKDKASVAASLTLLK